MFCRTCGNQIPDASTICTSCGLPTGVLASAPQYGMQPAQNFSIGPGGQQMVPYDPQAKSKIAAGLLSIFLGSFGVGRFYLGHVGLGIAQILVTLFTCSLGGWIWGLVEGIMILNGSIKTDAEGRLLRD